MESANLLKDSVTFSLSSELAVIAANELNETPTSRRQCLTELRKTLTEDINTCPTVETEEDEFLLRFLRCKKFDVTRAVSVYKGYHSFRSENAQLFENISPRIVRHVWETGVIGALPNTDKKGRAVMVAFPGRWDPESHSLEDMMKSMVLQLEHLITSIDTQINGIVLIADFTDFSFYQARCIKPWYFQMLSSLVQVSKWQYLLLLIRCYYTNLYIAC